ncbi:MAG: permease [Candidatus Neomarinimicrobiota bacterium]
MMQQIQIIFDTVLTGLLHIWPYLIITIPLAVAVQVSGASKKIGRAFNGRPVIAILLATIVGAFSPFCSCGVIPIIWSLLAGGVPLAPVMSFWLASPSMDPEMFFLSVSMLGWNTAVWRLLATFAMSITGGFITHGLTKSGWIGSDILRSKPAATIPNVFQLLKTGWSKLQSVIAPSYAVISDINTDGTAQIQRTVDSRSAIAIEESDPVKPYTYEDPIDEPEKIKVINSRFKQILMESKSATLLVAKFMAIALTLDALIKLYIPEAWISGTLGGENPITVVIAAVIGIPIYTTNITALPLIGGLLDQGMNTGAALAFLVVGPTTTIPAMTAVFGLTSRKVFILYLLFILSGGIIMGILRNVTGI